MTRTITQQGYPDMEMTQTSPPRKALVATLLAACLLSAPGIAATQSPPLELAVNAQQSLDIQGQPVRVLIADPSVADVQILPSGPGRPAALMLMGKKPGNTTVQIWLRGQETPHVRTVQVLGDMQASLPALPGVKARVQGGSAVLTGQAGSLLEHRAGVAAAQDAVESGQLLDTTVVGPAGVVQVDVRMVEISRNVLKAAGVSFGASNTRGGFSFGLAGGQSLGGNAWNIGASVLRGAFDLDVNLSLLQSNGLARVLAEPSLLAMSGQSASFLVGGELPIPTSGGLGTQTVEYKRFGIGLSVTPTVLASDRIGLKVAPEASELDWANAIPVGTRDSATLIPAIRTRRADTMVELGDGESFVIGGLVSRSTVASLDKVPLLGDLPVLGSFFRNMNYSQEEKELVIVVTPHLVRPIARGTALPLPGEGRDRQDSPGNAWGSYVLGPIGGDDLPGFSR